MAIIRLGLDDVTLNACSGWVQVRYGKGGKAREVPLSLDARKALAAWLEARERHPYADDPHLFLGQRGPLSGPGIYRIVTKYGRLAGIESLTPHTLRHTFAKNLIDAGEPLTVVAAHMGHESLNTLAIYTRPSREDLLRAVNGLT